VIHIAIGLVEKVYVKEQECKGIYTRYVQYYIQYTYTSCFYGRGFSTEQGKGNRFGKDKETHVLPKGLVYV
jgi:hypothetical protein